MELKNYQKAVLGDLRRFLALLTEKESIRKAYKQLWEEKGIPIGENGMPLYHMTIQGVPQVCIKVPTGGGKTYLAANAIKPIFEAMPHIHPKAVTWLVPSDAILRQTVRALTDHEHPYRQRIDVDFSNKVEIYTKEQLLNGQNFNPVSVDENLSIFVLTYDSFRASKKEGKKAYRENGNLISFSGFLDDDTELLQDADETALIQVIRKLNPVVIVDESHHATSKLSVEMLGNFNPCLVLELTATPKVDSNIISVVEAGKLKKEEMVKLPVIVYNLKKQDDVYVTAIALRKRLEEMALKAEKGGGCYIRPIVLFQAQPRINEDATTFEKIKKELLSIGIPENEIAIKTGEKDEIKDTDLMSKDCSIRYIITVNALKEGWDCPFAYILATVANRSSVVDVEQILGRVLRMPYARFGKNEPLNISYAITSSSEFHATLDKVVSGLVSAGFSKRDHRIAGREDNEEYSFADAGGQMSFGGQLNQGEEKISQNEEIPDIDTESVRRRLEEIEAATEQIVEDIKSEEGNISKIDQMISTAESESKVYWESISRMEEDANEDVPFEVIERMKSYYIRPEFREEAKELKIPQFVLDDQIAFFEEIGHELLDRETLRKGFTLKDKDTMIDFGNLDAEMARVDIGQDDIPKTIKITGGDNEKLKRLFEAKPTETKRRICKGIIVDRISKINAIGDADIEEYVDRIMGNMTEEELSALEETPEIYAKKIQEKVQQLLEEHEERTFRSWLEKDRIICEPHYSLKEKITPSKTISSIPKSLYEEEDGDLNDYEREVIWNLSALQNIRWWHRNISKKEFFINGAVVAYPDLIVRTENGRTLLIETKGDHLDNPVSKAKAQSGAEWAAAAGRWFRYFMVFESKKPGYAGAYSYDEFMDIVKGL